MKNLGLTQRWGGRAGAVERAAAALKRRGPKPGWYMVLGGCQRAHYFANNGTGNLSLCGHTWEVTGPVTLGTRYSKCVACKTDKAALAALAKVPS